MADACCVPTTFCNGCRDHSFYVTPFPSIPRISFSTTMVGVDPRGLGTCPLQFAISPKAKIVLRNKVQLWICPCTMVHYYSLCLASTYPAKRWFISSLLPSYFSHSKNFNHPYPFPNIFFTHYYSSHCSKQSFPDTRTCQPFPSPFLAA